MKGGNATPRDATARPAWEQELWDVEYCPVFQNEGVVIRSSSAALDDPDRHSQTFEYKKWKVRVDKFPRLDLADKPTIHNNPFEQQISKHMASTMMPNYSIDDDYARYLAADEQECFLYKKALKDYNRGLAEYEAHIWADSVQEEPQPKRRWLSKPPLKKISLPKNPKPTTKMSHQMWLKYWASLDKTEALLGSVTSGCYDHIPKDTIYITRDCKDRAILAVFPRGFEFVNEHLRPPKGHCGVYHWGTWFEQGQTKQGPIWSKDYRASGTCSGVLDGAYAVRLCQQLMQSLGVMTRALDLLFCVIDNPMWEQYRMAWEKLQLVAKVSTTEDELFTLCAVLINVLTEAHIDCNDWENRWAWVGVLGDFNGGDLCMLQLGIQVPMPAGSITGMRGRDLEHFITKWSGRQCYSVLHSFWDSIQNRCGPMILQTPRRKETRAKYLPRPMPLRCPTISSLATLMGKLETFIGLVT
ncbi:MAG: hypothetical protein M1839_002124 [Geoglossum umbratile]|nr:MAG: hypothetical protein M1839_002124 [Geoglossum umbratile]